MFAKNKNSEDITERTSCVDLSLINRNLNKKNISWLKYDHLTTSVHSAILISFTDIKDSTNDSITISKVIDFEKSKWPEFLSHYNQLKPKEIRLSNFESDMEQFCDSIEIAADRYLIYRKKKIYNNISYYNKKIDNLNEIITKLRRRLSHTKNETAKVKFLIEIKAKNAEKRYRIQSEKTKYLKSLFNVNDELSFWKNWSKSKIQDPLIMPIFESNLDNTLESNQSLLADHFVKKSEFKYKKLNLKNLDNLKLTNVKELNDIIYNLKINKSPGIDNITNRLLQILYSND